VIEIRGLRSVGIGAAHKLLPLQLPKIRQEFPELTGIHLGTLNVTLESALIVAVPDHRTKPIRWHADSTEGEVFDLLRIRLEAPIGAPEVRAWFYIPHWSPHRADPHLHEILAPKIDWPADQPCKIRVDRSDVFRYANWPMIIIGGRAT